MIGTEEKTKVVFGETFKRYTRNDMLEFISPFRTRFEVNGISTNIFKGRKCLDAGCGGGRGVLFMAEGGAKEITAFDLAEDNLETTKKFFREFGFSNILKTKQGNVLDMPFASDTFDFVWCNGVIHHTRDTFKAFSEICRVLKPEGLMWIYVYGDGGIYWYLINFIRQWMRGYDPLSVIGVLDEEGYPTSKIAEFIDDWFCPVLDKWSLEKFIRAVIHLNMRVLERVEYGMRYDTCYRNLLFNEEEWMGTGDLRFILRKQGERSEKAFDYIETRPEFSTEILNTFASAMYDVFYSDVPFRRRVIVSALLQKYLRNVMDTKRPFDSDTFLRVIQGAAI